MSGMCQVSGIQVDPERGKRGPYEEPPTTTFILPVRTSNGPEPAMLVFAAASPRLPVDDLYRSHFELLTAALGAALAAVRSREDERKRVAALAAIDRAKNAFFSNVSHEFRTPLTLMLGPLEDVLQSDALPGEVREQLERVQRNGLRLTRLVNSLLEFSRMEAGRAAAAYVATDIAAFTRELASSFESTFQRAGLELHFEASDGIQPVHLDRDMWEKIVLNLLSNAFKFTFEGFIKVGVRPDLDGASVEVSVQDSGTGIAAEQLPRVFERFYRIEGAEGRSIEGSGIGLSLAQDLVERHGGTIKVESAPGQGTTFTVRTPLAQRICRPKRPEHRDRMSPSQLQAHRTSKRLCKRRSSGRPAPKINRQISTFRKIAVAFCWWKTTVTCAATLPGCWPNKASRSKP